MIDLYVGSPIFGRRDRLKSRGRMPNYYEKIIIYVVIEYIVWLDKPSWIDAYILLKGVGFFICWRLMSRRLSVEDPNNFNKEIAKYNRID